MDDINLDKISGDILRRERLRRHLSLTDVEAETKIRLHYLDAIENDNLKALPPPVFAMGLIRTYALFLDLKPEPFVEAFKAKLGDTPKPVVLPESSRGPRVSRFPSVIVILVVAGLLLALVGYLYQQMAAYSAGMATPALASTTRSSLNIPTPLPSPPPPPPKVTPTAATTATPAVQPSDPVSQPVATLSPRPTATPKLPPTPTFPPTSTPMHGVTITVTISGRVWVQVESDGKVAFSGILLSGNHRTWKASKSIMLWVGNAGYVTVVYNGKNLGPLGAPGEELKVTWTATS